MFRDFFYMHKSDRRVILGLLTVGAVALAVIYLAGGRDADTPSAVHTTATDSLAADSIDTNQRALMPDMSSTGSISHELFAFDPNTADSAQLRRLGLSTYLIRNILHYRAAGGIYSTKEDFARLYGLTVKQYRELEPYISIALDYRPAATLFPNHRSTSSAVGDGRQAASLSDSVSAGFTSRPSTGRASSSPRYSMKLAAGETIELNSADTTALQRIPGIGSYYARRIADYRSRLGGFVSLDQLDEIDDLPQQTKQYLTLDNTSLRRINVNTATLNELKRHPYLDFYQARAIVDYRRQNGPIGSMQDLRLLPAFTPDAIERITPYVEY